MRTRLAALALCVAAAGAVAAVQARSPAPPEFTHASEADWINSSPKTLAGLRGQVVLIEFWTFDCSNCRRTLPWLKAMHEQYGRDGLVIVAVHTPEFAHERSAANVSEAVKRLGIEYAVMLDSDFSYWKALRNSYWPAFYLVTRNGTLAAREIGELHRGTARGDRFEKRIREALAER